MTADIAAGVPMFSRERALSLFLDSVPDYVTTVYVADNGEADDRDLYHESYPFDLDVNRLAYDCGIGQCRADIADRCDEQYLWVGDCDMEIVNNDDLRTLRSLLEQAPHLGGVSGWLVEGDQVRSGARNMIRNGSRIIKTVPSSPTVYQIPIPHAEFDFLPQAGLFRMAAIENYSWDPDMFNSEHIDFFLGHQETDWQWASTPAVVTLHHRDIDPEYRETKRGNNHVDWGRISEKWGISSAHPGPRPDWNSTRDRSPGERAFDLFRSAMPPSIWIPARRIATKGGLA